MAALALALSASGCTAPEATSGSALPWDPGSFPDVIPPDPAAVELGRTLFYDPVLGEDGLTACATCHSEHWGMGDGLPVSVGLHGVGAVGPGRRGPNQTRRNAQTLYNVVFRERLFWDGRALDLEHQVSFPLEDPGELGSSEAAVLARLRALPEYTDWFARVFPGEILSFPLVTRALRAFQEALISDWAPYDRYAAGDLGALDERAQEGMRLFAAEGCADCHTPPRFEREHYASRGQPSPPGVSDEGRAEVTGRGADIGGFRVPTLRNLRDSEPYFHAGSAATLEDAVRDELSLDRQRRGEPPPTEEDVALISHFLKKGLTDRTRDQPRPAHVPSGLPVPLDGFRVPR
ncbi:MAG: hypothetical protein KIT72_00785 [Polyangiaceae bacterium]|nr:hypothetical protein [Polyangiaceae bacterium]MCW5788931.1 hypothetical protein [Polyangiaceae bacterium]